MSQRYNGNTKRPKLQDTQLGILGILPENVAEGLGSRREHCWGYISVNENIPEKLWIYQKSCHTFLIKVVLTLLNGSRKSAVGALGVIWLSSVLRLHANTSSQDVYRREQPNQWAHLELCQRNLDILEMVLKQIVLSNSTAMVCPPMQVVKKNRSWGNFNNQGTKMILLSHKLWLIANNSKSFADGSKSIIRINLILILINVI